MTEKNEVTRPGPTLTLWQLLVGCSFAGIVGGAFAIPYDADAGAAGWATAASVVGVFAYVTSRLNRVAGAYGDRLLAEPDSGATEGRFRLLYGLAILWTLSGGLIAGGVVSALLSLHSE